MAEIEFQFQPGDLIVPTSGPFIKTLSGTYKGQICDGCFQPGILRRCTGCQKMHYCGKRCQKGDWREGHLVECKSEVFKNPGGVATEANVFPDPDLIPKLLRILAKFHLQPASFSEKHLVYGDFQRSFNDMISHEQTISDHLPTSDFLSRLYAKLKTEDSSFGPVDFDVDFLKRIFGVWKTNAFEISDAEDSKIIGGGLYIAHSAFDHACRNNAVRIGTVERQEVRCIHPIRKGDTPRISYLAGNRSPDQRKSVLQSRYNFTCRCELCAAEESGPMIDYSELEIIKNKLKRCYFAANPYQEAIELRDQGLKLFRRLYNEYDERITDFCSVAFYIICVKTVPKSFLLEEAKDMDNRLKITYGKATDHYSIFQQSLQQSGIELTA